VIASAIEEFRTLVAGLSRPIDDRQPAVRYLCALVAELAYHHVPQWEIERGPRRAKLIPSEAYQAIVERGIPTTLDTVFGLLDLGDTAAFVVEDRGVIAVGVTMDRLLFVGFRGTQFLFDWKINLRARLRSVGPLLLPASWRIGPTAGRVHGGFADESTRISYRLLDALKRAGPGTVDRVFLTGHSLGGAIAALSEQLLFVWPTSVCMLGAPRYADVSWHPPSFAHPPHQVRRPGDIVPLVPPRSFGYANHPSESATDGTPYVDPPDYSSTRGGLLRWGRFLAGRFTPHSVEAYRRELGVTAGASGALLPLIADEKATGTAPAVAVSAVPGDQRAGTEDVANDPTVLAATLRFKRIDLSFTKPGQKSQTHQDF
jgi:hypothetical protein